MMECLQIDWKNIDATFEKDDFYENIQAPKWIDFSVPLHPVDDCAWFCGKSGCTHTTKTVLQALKQKSMVPFQRSTTFANTMDLLGTKTISAGVATKKARALVSSSLSSLSEIKAGCVKNKVLPPIGERKGGIAKNNRRQQACENENPNRVCKVQDGACEKPLVKTFECISKQTKMSESKRPGCKEAGIHASMRLIKAGGSTLSEHVNLSQSGPLLEASKSVFIFGKRDVKSSLNKDPHKEPTSDLSSINVVKSNSTGGIRQYSRLPPSARNPYLSASFSMPNVRRSAASARPLHGVYLGNKKVAECKPPRVIRDVRVSVQEHALRRINDHKKEAEEGKLPERRPQKATELHQEHTLLLAKKHDPHPSLPIKNDELKRGVADSIALAYTASRESSSQLLVQDQELCSVGKNEELPSLSNYVEDTQPPYPLHEVAEKSQINILQESKSNDVQTREKEDSITNTLEKFLENLHIAASDKDELVLTEELSESNQKLVSRDNVTGQNTCNELNGKEPDMVGPCHEERTIEQDASQSDHMGNGVLQHEARTVNHRDCAPAHDLLRSCSEDNALENAARCSHQSNEMSHGSKPLQPKEENNPASVGLHIRGRYKGNVKDMIVLTDNDKGLKKLQQKQDSQIRKDCKRHIGTKRKSSELNLNCGGKDNKHDAQKSRKFLSTAKLATVPASQPQDWCEEQPKRMKTTTQAFKPFRLRTEERGALKELGLAKKDSGNPNTKETVELAMHHALRMPSFGHPFRPQRSTKKLTIPREPKFHVSRTKNKSTNLAVGIGSP